MSLFSCLDSKLWTVGFYCLGVYYILLFFYSFIPLVYYRSYIKSLSTVNKVHRYLIPITLFLKSMTFFFSSFLYHKVESKMSSLMGLLLYETPGHLISTCYTFFLLSLFLTISDFIPTGYSKILHPGTLFIIFYNVVIYSLFLAHIVFEIFDICTSKDYKHTQTIIAIICLSVRDMFLAFIFIFFIIKIQKIFGQSNYQDITHEENQLRCLTIVLSILLLFRGVISNLQLTTFNSKTGKYRECGTFFFVIVLCFEVFIDSSPLVYMIHINTKYISRSLLLSTAILDTSNHVSYN